ncbi:MAG: hypothetical protein V3V08_01565 [Nannocystaceae bacterium]
MLVEVRSQYEATPRAFDEELTRRARGDRGCLSDTVAGLGALLATACGLLSAAGVLRFESVLVGVALLCVGFVTGSIGQLRSGRERREALEAGPLVAGFLISHTPALDVVQRATARGVAVFSTEPSRRFDTDYLRAVAGTIRHWTPLEADSGRARMARTLGDASATGVSPVPEGQGVLPGTWVADVMIYPSRIDGGRMVSTDPLTVGLIVDVERGLVEHV